MYWLINILSAFLLSLLFAGVMIPQILLVAFRKRLFDIPDERKVHQQPVPRLGGFAFTPVICFTMSLLLGVNMAVGETDMFMALESEALSLAFLFCAALMLYLVGLADDLIGVRYRAKFFVQILCACFMIAGGVWLDNLYGIFGIHALPPLAGYVLTILVVVFIINSINLIDGIDGLASGLCSCALLVYAIAFFLYHQYVYSMLSFATFGVLVPFFYYNVYGNPHRHQKIFMGDTGALTIGIMVCFLSIKLTDAAGACDAGPNPMAIAFSPLIIPCFDVLRVYFYRVRNRKNPFLPDKNHIHHKLLALGLKHRTVMMTIVISSMLIIACNVWISEFMNITVLLIVDLLLWTLLNVWISGKRKRL